MVRFAWRNGVSIFVALMLLPTAGYAVTCGKHTVCGQVLDTTGAPVAGLLVKIWDDDVDIGAKKDDDFMEQGTTGPDGTYQISYQGKKWDPDIKINESWRPDIYAVVFVKNSAGEWAKVAKSKTHKDHKMAKGLPIYFKIPKNEWLVKRTGFEPERHGFSFPNSKEYTGAKWGACGGMSLTALRRYRSGKPVEAHADGKLRNELADAQRETVLPGHWGKFVEWQAKPTLPHTTSPHTIGHSTKGELHDLRAKIDKGSPVILGLIRVQSAIARDVEENHQVLAIGYAVNDLTNDWKVYVYDPNHPGKTCVIPFNTGLPQNQIKAREMIPDSKDVDIRKAGLKEDQIKYGVSPVRGFFLIREGSAPVKG